MAKAVYDHLEVVIEDDWQYLLIYQKPSLLYKKAAYISISSLFSTPYSRGSACNSHAFAPCSGGRAHIGCAFANRTLAFKPIK